jgi:hypothetical protein
MVTGVGVEDVGRGPTFMPKMAEIEWTLGSQWDQASTGSNKCQSFAIICGECGQGPRLGVVLFCRERRGAAWVWVQRWLR